MDKIIRRWEWRAFGSHFETAEKVFASMTPLGDPAESDETYILGPGDVNVKIRFSLLDIKKLMEVDANGLELWTPISKVEFPVPAEAALEVFDAWGLDRPGSDREIYELDHFLDELIDPHPELEIVSVHKRRVRYSFDGCMSELTEISANGREARTIAVEDPDQATVVSNVEQLGVSDHVNMSYNRGL
ncbi:MAG TPA: Ppx/GppA family phosphatase, partial [Acidimicrobiia bacterium]